MTVLADFQTIIGDNPQQVNTGVKFQKLGDNFDTSGRRFSNSEIGGDAAFLIFSVLDVRFDTEVFVNREGPVGIINHTEPGHWSTQIIAMAGVRLKSGLNSIEVGDVRQGPFLIKDLICFYHQDSD